MEIAVAKREAEIVSIERIALRFYAVCTFHNKLCTRLSQFMERSSLTSVEGNSGLL